MVETMENGRRQTWTAANVAALMFGLLAMSSVAATVLWGIGEGYWGSAWGNGSSALVALILAAGLWRRSKIAYWLALLGSSALILMTLITIPSFIRAIHITTRQASGAYMTPFFLIFLACGSAMLIAFIALLSKSARREFGIGRFAAAPTVKP